MWRGALFVALAAVQFHGALAYRSVNEKSDGSALRALEPNGGNSQSSAKSSGPQVLSGDISTVSWNDASRQPWTFYYAEWSPHVQKVLRELASKDAIPAFAIVAKMECVSSFEDALEAEGVMDLNDPELVRADLIDINEHLAESQQITCDRRYSQGQDAVWKEMEEAHNKGHDHICSGQDFGPHSVPALVIGGVKHCGSDKIGEWLKVNAERIKLLASVIASKRAREAQFSRGAPMSRQAPSEPVKATEKPPQEAQQPQKPKDKDGAHSRGSPLSVAMAVALPAAAMSLLVASGP